jgi:hypothetical protein
VTLFGTGIPGRANLSRTGRPEASWIGGAAIARTDDDPRRIEIQK